MRRVWQFALTLFLTISVTILAVPHLTAVDAAAQECPNNQCPPR